MTIFKMNQDGGSWWFNRILRILSTVPKCCVLLWACYNTLTLNKTMSGRLKITYNKAFTQNNKCVPFMSESNQQRRLFDFIFICLLCQTPLWRHNDTDRSRQDKNADVWCGEILGTIPPILKVWYNQFCYGTISFIPWNEINKTNVNELSN